MGFVSFHIMDILFPDHKHGYVLSLTKCKTIDKDSS